jgi:hypothetical protein
MLKIKCYFFTLKNDTPFSVTISVDEQVTSSHKISKKKELLVLPFLHSQPTTLVKDLYFMLQLL